MYFPQLPSSTVIILLWGITYGNFIEFYREKNKNRTTTNPGRQYFLLTVKVEKI